MRSFKQFLRESKKDALEAIRDEFFEATNDEDWPKDPDEFIDDYNVWELEELFPIYSDHFESDPTKYKGTVYHHTDQENIDSIIKNGLNPMNKTRGMTNRGTGNAIFTSKYHHEMSSYGDAMVAINLGAAKNANPDITTQLEEPVKEELLRIELARFLGVEREFMLSTSDGIMEDTLVVFGSIPPEFIQVTNEDGDVVHTGKKF